MKRRQARSKRYYTVLFTGLNLPQNIDRGESGEALPF
jgi:hypothetical protein